MESIINVVKYPILEQGSTECNNLITETRHRYLREGVVTLPEFLVPSAISSAISDIDASQAWVTDTEHNIYLDGGSDHGNDQNSSISLGVDHVRNRKLHTKVASLAYDRLGETAERRSVLKQLYENESFRDFLRQVLGLPELHRLADPLGACSINIFSPGWTHAWHYDESHFSTTLMLQEAEQGGKFEHTAPIRKGTKPEEDDHDLMSAILSAGSAHPAVNELKFEPGTLSIFSGSRCLHRVTDCGGHRDRLVAVLCFARQQGVMNSPQVQEMFWGRTAAE